MLKLIFDLSFFLESDFNELSQFNWANLAFRSILTQSGLLMAPLPLPQLPFPLPYVWLVTASVPLSDID